ncbi:hypothetical protein [Pseudomonas putida]|uniref:Uncharacterized protein n=1 Tax=Pseudomonas putida TaxID=303 RepID=A0A8I1ECG2_PSEPU|nr:hypothetical protein [Pseudomonas putida]MBI6882733.1 hypothetical protein [Pseudomonas putida]
MAFDYMYSMRGSRIPLPNTPFMLSQFEEEQWAESHWVARCSAFSEIEDALIDESVSVAWLCNGGHLFDIPEEHWSESVLLTAVRKDVYAFDLIDESLVDDYRALAVEASKAGTVNFANLPEAYCNEGFVLELISVGALSVEGIDFAGRYAHLLTDRVIEAICTKSLSNARYFSLVLGKFTKDRINDEYVRKAIPLNHYDLHCLEDLGKTHVLVDMLVQGYWPPSLREYPNHPCPEAPATVNDGFAIYSTTECANMRTLHKCWMQTRPVEELAVTLKGPAGLDLLFEIVPDDKIRRFAHKNRGIAGRLVGNDMGM